VTGTGDPLRDTISANTTAPELRQLADLVADYRLKLDELEEQEKAVRGDYEAAESALFDALENAGIRQIRTPRGLFTLNDLAWAKIEDPEKARAWADQNMPDLLTLNIQRLSPVIRHFLKGDADAGIDAIPEGITYTLSRKITWRRQ
jgi:hypothetical protein